MLRRIGCGLALALVLTACGDGRSVEAYCSTFYGDGQELRQRWLDTNASRDPLAGMAQLFSAPRDLAVFFDELSAVAPDDIRPDVETVRDTFQSQADSLGDKAGDIASGPMGLFGALAGDLATGFATAPAMQRIDTWTSANCGPPPAS
ncbi:MAG: hypothetical protein L0I24_01565 [Pseudonocardia sp.]|nr:hypothetical protein [Pseudonocardia sp.]